MVGLGLGIYAGRVVPREGLDMSKTGDGEGGPSPKAQRIYASANMNTTGDGPILFPPVPSPKWALLLVSFTPILPNAADTWTIATSSGIILVSLTAAQTYFDFSSGLLFYGGEQMVINILSGLASGVQVNAVAQVVPLL